MNGSGDDLSPAEADRLERLRSARSLSALVPMTGAETEHDAYLAARREWRGLMERAVPAAAPSDDHLPGDAVVVDGRRFVVHGITHADTDAERRYLREHVSGFLGAGETVFCEQGIRSMYFSDMPDACAMDDYRWALQECRKLDVDSHLDGGDPPDFDGLLENLTGVAATFREATFSLLHSGADIYGREFAMALGDVATDFLTSHEDLARAREFEAFVRSKRAAEDPSTLGELQRYYATVFLPQPVEREWLRRHDPELEVVSHGRSERMADYAAFHADDAETVHLVTGAAHQPGIVHYLERHRDGHRCAADLELVE
ncbi:hypothetical protein [Natronomonas marina]|jgi:hypothetical protein|uniref:hypothetical protein n=1 Tax=Natronomonas marina TaxID=2961939 RepID=UPI0020C9E710|nr:hypothetical protein [Natronomonas marina]